MSRFNTSANLGGIVGEQFKRVRDLTLVEPWHVVGGTGEPAFVNSWVNFGGAEETGGFYLDPYGTVQLRGLVKNGATAGGTTIFTLPAGYRPLKTRRFVCVFSNIGAGTNGAVYMAVDTTGAVLVSVVLSGTIANLNSWIDLSPIRFRAEA